MTHILVHDVIVDPRVVLVDELQQGRRILGRDEALEVGLENY